MNSDQADVERNAKIEKTRQRVLNEIFGKEVAEKVVEVPEVEVRTTDKNWNTQKSWMSQTRVTTPMNNDFSEVGYYNKLLHDNNGVMVIVSNEKPGMAIDPIK